MSVNPFEPPRSGDEGGAGALSGGTDLLPEAAFRELVKSAPWARWIARLGLASGLLTVVYSAVMLRKGGTPAQMGSQLFSLVVSVPMLIIWVILARRYAAHAERLPTRDPAALAGVIDAQRALFTVLGVLMLISIGLMVLGAIVGALLGLGARA